MYKIQGWVEQGNTVIETSGLPSSNVAQGSFPGALITVYVHGSVVLATLYSDDNTVPTPLANPFTSNSDGSFGFYAITGRYDVVFSGGDLTSPVTVDDVTNGAGGGSGDVVGPAVAVDSDIALFDGVTGKLLKDSGSTIAQLTAAILASVTTPSLCNGRLTLASNYPVYAPQPATPSSTDTGTEVVTFAANHGWVTGTRLTIAATIGGLTAGTLYYFNALSASTGAFYTTLANAIADTSRVNLTANVTNQLLPSGVEGRTIYFTPFNGAKISVYDGAAWTTLSFTQLSLALGTLTGSIGYDVFVYSNSGVLTLELLAWSSATARATALVLQDGVLVKSGATTRRYLGSIYTDTTTSTVFDYGNILTNVGPRFYVWNLYNPVQISGSVFDSTASWTFTSAAYRQARATAGNRCEFFQGLTDLEIGALVYGIAQSGSATWKNTSSGVGIDSTTVNSAQMFGGLAVGNTAGVMALTAEFRGRVAVGYHAINWLEFGDSGGATAISWFGRNTGNVFSTGLFLTIRG